MRQTKQGKKSIYVVWVVVLSLLHLLIRDVRPHCTKLEQNPNIYHTWNICRISDFHITSTWRPNIFICTESKSLFLFFILRAQHLVINLPAWSHHKSIIKTTTHLRTISFHLYPIFCSLSNILQYSE